VDELDEPGAEHHVRAVLCWRRQAHARANKQGMATRWEFGALSQQEEKDL
jgi:hypothetical protein